MTKSYLDFMKRSRSAKARGDLYVQLEVLDIAPFSVVVGQTRTVQLQVIYEPGRALSFEVTSLQDWLWVDSNGLVTIDTSGASAGSHVATIRVSDGRDVVETDLTFEVEARLFEASLKRSGPSNLPTEITVNGTTVDATLAYNSKDASADATSWPSVDGSHGPVLGYAGIGGGQDFTTGNAAPFTNDDDNLSAIGKSEGGADCYSGGNEGDVGMDDLVFEGVVAPGSYANRYLFNKSPGRAISGDVGYDVCLVTTGSQLVVTLGDGVNSKTVNYLTGFPSDVWFHFLICIDRDAVDGVRIFINGALVRVGSVTEVTGSLDNSGDLGILGAINGSTLNTYRGAVSWLAMWNAADLFPGEAQNAEVMSRLAAERSALVWGVSASFARGDKHGSFSRSTMATLDTILSDDSRRLFTVAPNAPRIERRLNTNSRNLVANSEKLSDVSWGQTNVSVEDDAIDAPLGLQASLVTATGVDGDHYISSDVDIDADEAFVCLSFLVKAKDSSWVCLSSLQSGDGDVWIDIENAVVGTNTLTEDGTVTVRRVPDHPGWVRVSLTQTAFLDANVRILPAPADGVASFDPSVTPASAYFTAVQVEKVADISKGPTTYSPKPYYVGYLQEGTTTNLIDNSSDFTASAWQKGEVIVDPNAVGTPFGKSQADAIIASTTNSTLHRWRHYADVVAGQFYVLSAYFKPGAQRWLRIGADQLSANAYIDTQDLDSSEMTSGINAWGYDNFDDGWVRVWVNFTASATTQRLQYFYLQNDRSGTSFAGDGVTPGIFMFGVQCERVAHLNDGPSSLIETTGVDATRVIDNFSFSSYLNADPFAGVLACTGRALHHGSLTENDTYLASITDDVGDNRASVLWNNGQQAYLNIRKDNVQIVNAGELPPFELRNGDAHTLVGVFGKGGARLLRDGNHVFGPGSTVAPEVATKIQVGARDTPSLPFRGHLCDIRIRGDNDYEAVVI